MTGGTIADDGASRAVLTDAGGTVSAVSLLEEVQPDMPRQAIRIADVAAEKRMRTRTQYTRTPRPSPILGYQAGFH